MDGLDAPDIDAETATNATPFELSPFVHRAKRTMVAGDTDVTPIADPRGRAGSMIGLNAACSIDRDVR